MYSRLFPPTCIAIVPIHSVPVPPPSLTLKECKINVSIIDAHSRVTLSQQFQNQSDLEAGQVTYTFSMLASAAVCDFEMVRQDGTKVIGIAKEKEQARRELETALAAGHTAALGEEQTKDIFSICIGNVLPQETITINLSYINTLIDDESPNQVRFTLPRVYMQRYGTAPEGRIYGSVGHEDVPFTMDVSIQQAGRIRSVTCPSGFNLSVNLGRPDHLDASTEPDANFAVVNVRRTNTSAPSKDVIIIITADGLDKPRAFIEPHPVHQTDAIGLTLVPQFKPIESPLGMEYIFLVDRSGSMRDTNIDMARTAHTVLLQGLPSKNTTFNIFSFGSGVSSLWPVSQAYDQNSVDTAMSHIKAMEADYGGTEIARALKAVYKSLVTPLVRPISIFLLTDGGAWDVESCTDITKKAIQDHATDSTFMRVFTVGLGQGASTATCDGIARAGGGMAVYIATSEEEYLGKCARLVRAARTAPVSDIKVSWPGPAQAARGGERERSVTLEAPIDLFQPDTDHIADDELGPLPAAVQQAPSVIPSFFPSSRFQIFAIIPRGAASVEQEIKITGFVRAANVPVEIAVPLQNLMYSPHSAFIHTSAAKALITELEDKVTSGSQETSRADIVRLGTAYGLSSRFTSFIAVDDTHRLPIGVANSSRAERPEGGASLFGASPMAMATQAQFNTLSCMSSMPTFVPAARYAPQGTLFGSANPQNGQFQNMSSTPTSSAWSPRGGVQLRTRNMRAPNAYRERERESLPQHLHYSPARSLGGGGHGPPPDLLGALAFPASSVNPPAFGAPSYGSALQAMSSLLPPPPQIQHTRVSYTDSILESPRSPPRRKLSGRPLASSALPPPAASSEGMPVDANVANIEDKTPDTKEAVLVMLARLQRFDGSFASNSASVIELLGKLGGDGARGVFEKHGLVGEVASVLLAWAWMSLCCDVEAEGMKEKADLWLHGNTEGFDVDAVQRELLNVVVFRPL